MPTDQASRGREGKTRVPADPHWLLYRLGRGSAPGPTLALDVVTRMLPTWLIEAGVFGDEAVPLLDEIRRQGMAAEVVPHQSL